MEKGLKLGVKKGSSTRIPEFIIKANSLCRLFDKFNPEI